ALRGPRRRGRTCLQVPPVLLGLRRRRAAQVRADPRLRQGRVADPALQPVVARGSGVPVIASLVFGITSILQPLEDAVRWLLDRMHYDIGLPWAWAIVATTVVV